eukprot:TRINITY_DN9726_c0_g1_i1.p1 TRINITY_DN9726_c0_g1~~TRINITY_DN9726_c0_g1_i1.p1  ORF type:complete len:975 (+),score=227.76 TRINITY_DN9726_c0_g1_i1:92-3016(+)
MPGRPSAESFQLPDLFDEQAVDTFVHAGMDPPPRQDTAGAAAPPAPSAEPPAEAPAAAGAEPPAPPPPRPPPTAERAAEAAAAGVAAASAGQAAGPAAAEAVQPPAALLSPTAVPVAAPGDPPAAGAPTTGGAPPAAAASASAAPAAPAAGGAAPPPETAAAAAQPAAADAAGAQAPAAASPAASPPAAAPPAAAPPALASPTAPPGATAAALPKLPSTSSAGGLTHGQLRTAAAAAGVLLTAALTPPPVPQGFHRAVAIAAAAVAGSAAAAVTLRHIVAGVASAAALACLGASTVSGPHHRWLLLGQEWLTADGHQVAVRAHKRRQKAPSAPWRKARAAAPASPSGKVVYQAAYHPVWVGGGCMTPAPVTIKPLVSGWGAGRVRMLGCVSLLSSTPHTIRWSDGDVWTCRADPSHYWAASYAGRPPDADASTADSAFFPSPPRHRSGSPRSRRRAAAASRGAVEGLWQPRLWLCAAPSDAEGAVPQRRVCGAASGCILKLAQVRVYHFRALQALYAAALTVAHAGLTATVLREERERLEAELRKQQQLVADRERRGSVDPVPLTAQEAYESSQWYAKPKIPLSGVLAKPFMCLHNLAYGGEEELQGMNLEELLEQALQRQARGPMSLKQLEKAAGKGDSGMLGFVQKRAALDSLGCVALYHSERPGPRPGFQIPHRFGRYWEDPPAPPGAMLGGAERFGLERIPRQEGEAGEAAGEGRYVYRPCVTGTPVTALHWACLTGHDRVAAWLIMQGASVDGTVGLPQWETAARCAQQTGIRGAHGMAHHPPPQQSQMGVTIPPPLGLADAMGHRRCANLLRRGVLLSYGPVNALSCIGEWQGSVSTLLPEPPSKRDQSLRAQRLRSTRMLPCWRSDAADRWLTHSCPPRCAVEVASVMHGEPQRVVCHLMTVLCELRRVGTLPCGPGSPKRPSLVLTAEDGGANITLAPELCKVLWEACYRCPSTPHLCLPHNDLDG